MARLADPKVRQKIAKNLRRVLRNQPKGVVALANELGMPQAQLSGYLRDHRGFSIETLLRFAVGLDCLLDDLLYDVNPAYTAGVFRRRSGSPDLTDEMAIILETLRVLTPGQRQRVLGVAREFAELEAPLERTSERSAESPPAARPTRGTRRRRQG